jgi:hypothetical protein
MSPPRPFTGKLERGTLWVAAVSGAAALALSCFETGSVSLAYQLAVFTCMAPAMGCLILVLIHRTAGGQWASGISPFLRAGVALLPWIWLLALPILVLPQSPSSVSHRFAHGGWGYDGFAMVSLRAVFFALLFFGFRWAIAGDVGREKEPTKNRQRWVGPVGLIVLFFILTLLADDWLESLEPRWHSTGFTVVWMAGQVVSALSLVLLLGIRSGARPGISGVSGRPLGLDWGNLLLAAMVFWSYVTFAQFLIIWAGNLPEEIGWYLRREKGGWGYVIPCLAVIGFAAPFLILLSRRMKASAAGLATAAGLLFATHTIYMIWVIVPAGGPLTPGTTLLFLAFLAAGGGLFVNRFAHAAGRPREESP